MILEEKKVGFIEAIKHFWKGYFDFKGRTKRSGYWWAVLFVYLVLFALLVIGLSLLMAFIGDTDDLSKAYYSMGITGISLIVIFVIFAIAIFIPCLSLTVRRWRDAGLTTSGIITVWVVNFCFAIISTYYENFGDMLLDIVSILVFVISLLPTNQLTTTSNNSVMKFFFRERLPQEN